MVHFRMPRFGKKTLYLDLDALERIEATLQRLPGRTSLSSFLNEQLPTMARVLDDMVAAAERGGLRGLSDMLFVAAQTSSNMIDQIEPEVKKTLLEAKNPDAPLSELMRNVPPKKVRKTAPKKVVQT